MDRRDLEYFVAVAEELHFGRAAERLGIAQPPLSRAIRALERRLRVTLFARTSRRVSLTPAGDVLLREGRRALDALDAATRRTTRAGQGAPRLVLATKPGGDSRMLPDILAAYRAQPDAIAVEVAVCGIGEVAAHLRDGRADVALLHRPFDDLSGFDHEELKTEPMVAVLPAGHRLAGRESLAWADLAGEPLPSWPGDKDSGPGPAVRDGGQLMYLIALGEAVAVLPESCRDDLRAGLVTVPMRDAEPVVTLLAWPEGSRSRALAGFVRAACEAAAYANGFVSR
ncbi:LysR family transcriptional regulator [Virgisporangium aliadipatigenens]|uniref:LysR family transcriptional regulator n=1 Tax=Virgisporangium aliadipatigenens TaxID=741659 RepID=UPI0019435672|nr:LysR family transcriptional regulator [Virgisporangium aliadipatigenens]